MAGEGRNFRRRTARFWSIWALPPLVDEIHRVVHLDGLYLNRKTVILIAMSEKHVLGWYVAKSENSRAWEALLSRIAPPEVMISDGGSGLERARRRVWPHTAHQRCTFHAFCQVKRHTTSRPRLEAGKELYVLAKELLRVKDIDHARRWLQRYSLWCTTYSGFLAETTLVEGRYVLTHERLVKARNSLNTLINKQTLFTYLDPELTRAGPLPATNNRIEGAVNSQLRHLLCDHRGMSLIRRIKAVFWWCYMHTEFPLPSAELLKEMPTDEEIADLFKGVAQRQEMRDSLPGLGNAVVWDDFHVHVPYHSGWN
jgi:hypothetical protein